MMKTLLLILLLLPSLAFGQGYFDGYTTGYGVTDPVEPEVITTIVSTRLTYPNTNLPAETYDVENKANDGSSIRYGFLSYHDQSNVQAASYRLQGYLIYSERGGTAELNRIPLVWLSLNGVKAGTKINRADFYINNGHGSDNQTSGGYFAVRVDTIASDYSVLDHASSSSDPCLLDASYLYKNTTGTADSWVPAMSTRTSGWHYGIRSNDLHGFQEQDATLGAVNVFDLTDAVQQIVDRGQDAIDRGLLLMVYGVSTAGTAYLTVGDHTSVVEPNGGNPAIVIETSSRRGDKEWGNGKMPICLTFDDSYDAQVGIFPNVIPPNMALVTNGELMDSWVDSLYTLHSDDIDIIFHGDIHAPWPTYTGAALNAQLDHHQWMTSANFTVMPDTVEMDAAWTGGGTAMHSFEPLYKLVGYGYRSARGVTHGQNWTLGTRTPIGFCQTPSWDGYTNLFAMTAKNLGSIVGDAGIIEDKAIIKERFMRWVDWAHSDNGHGALLTYGHSTGDYVTKTNMATLYEIIDECDYIELRSYRELMGTMTARPRIDIETVVSETSTLWVTSLIDSVIYHRASLSAATQDSFADFQSTSIADLFDQMWVGPAGE